MFAGRRSTTTTFTSSGAEESPWRRFPTMLARLTEAGRRSRQKDSPHQGTVGRSVSCFAMGASASAPPLSPCCLSPVTQLRKDVQTLSQTTRSSAARRSLKTSTSPVLAPRCHSPVRATAGGNGAASGSRTTAPVGVPLSSPIKLNSEFHLDVVNRNSVYKERFPKAKAQMEEKLAAFVAEHAPLSGGSSTGDNDTGQDGANNRRSMVSH
ncbi:hypothetical protein GCK32_018399 [Trichostrongylus colubriformis]|uniref:Microtubule-associated serine/threonine-protein kinase pre-PK domain-containing protein n=1 Tax=Trichostrongylus colubriformis TaxID=6319 RepID=A0AAN8FQN1_TRICO